MFSGSPRASDSGPVTTTSSDETETETGGNSESESESESSDSSLVAAARTASDIISPFTGLLTSIVQLITVAQFARKI